LSGEVLALVSALLWSVASVLMALGSHRLHVLPLNLIRCTVSSAFFWVLLPFYGGLEAFRTVPSSAWLWLWSRSSSCWWSATPSTSAA